MYLSFKHKLGRISKDTPEEEFSPFFTKGNTKWRLSCIREEHNKKKMFHILLYAELVDYSIRHETKIIASYRAVILDQSGLEEGLVSKADHYCFKRDEFFNTRVSLYFLCREELSTKYSYLTANDEMLIDVAISLENMESMEYYPLVGISHNFHCLEDSDVKIVAKDGILYSHSQILKLHSVYFRKKICQEEIKKIRQCYCQRKEKNEPLVIINVNFADVYTLETLLSIIYMSDNHAVKETNILKVLDLSNKLSTRVVDLICASFLNDYLQAPESKPSSSQTSPTQQRLLSPVRKYTKEEILLFAWKYDLDGLKIGILKKFSHSRDFKKIHLLPQYAELSAEKKLDLCESIISSLR